MSREQMMDYVRAQMPERRWTHTLGVMQSAVQLAHRYGADPVKAELAALLHDVAKYWPIEKQRQIVIEHQLEPDMLNYDPQLLHSHVGAHIAQERFAINDQEVLNAIRYHTSGREQMSLLDKVLCLADYIEPGRDYPQVEKIRQLAESSLEEALVAGFDSTIQFLISRGKKVYPLTVQARNGLIDEIRGRSQQ